MLDFPVGLKIIQPDLPSILDLVMSGTALMRLLLSTINYYDLFKYKKKNAEEFYVNICLRNFPINKKMFNKKENRDIRKRIGSNFES